MKIQKKRPGKAHPLKNELLLHSRNISGERERSWRSRTHRLKRFEPVGGSEATSPFSPRPSPLYSRQKFPHLRRKKSRQLSARKEDASLSLSHSLYLSLSLTLTLPLSFSSGNIGSNYHPFSLLLSLRLAPKLWPEILFSYVTFYLSFARNPFSKMSHFWHIFLYVWLFYENCTIC